MDENRIYLTTEDLKALDFCDEAKIFSLPPEDSDDEKSFRTSLRHGQHNPIVLKVKDGARVGLDGRRRVRAAIAEEIGLMATVRDNVVDDLDEVLDLQFSRREMSVAQRALLMATPMIRSRYQAEAKGRQGRRDIQPAAAGGRGQWREVAAAVAKVGKEAIREAVAIVDKGLPILRDLVAADVVPLGASAKFVAKYTAEQQAAFLAEGQEVFISRINEMRSASGRAAADSRLRGHVPRPRHNFATSSPAAAPGEPINDVILDANSGDVADGSADDLPDATAATADEPLDAGAENLPDVTADVVSTDEPETDEVTRPAPAPTTGVRRAEGGRGVKQSPIQFDAALRALFGAEPRVFDGYPVGLRDDHDVVFASDAFDMAMWIEHLLGKPDRHLALVVVSTLRSGPCQNLLRARPTCVVAALHEDRPWVVSYFGSHIGKFVAAFTKLGAVVVPAQPGAPADDIIKFSGPGGVNVRGHRHSDVVWVAPTDVLKAFKKKGIVIDEGLPSRKLLNGRDPQLKVVPARALGERLRERPALIGTLKGEEREAWCAFLEGLRGAQ